MNVPVPAFTSVTGAAPFWITPEKVVLVLAPPVVSVAEDPALVTVPLPESEPMLVEKPPRSRLVPEESVTAELLPKAVAEPAFNVPPMRAVAPV